MKLRYRIRRCIFTKVGIQNEWQNTSILHSKVPLPSNKNGWFCVRAELELSCIFRSNKTQLTRQIMGSEKLFSKGKFPMSFKNADMAVATYEHAWGQSWGLAAKPACKNNDLVISWNVLISRSNTELWGKRDGTELSANQLSSMTALKISPAASEWTMV